MLHHREVDKLKRDTDAWLAIRTMTNIETAKFVKATIDDMPDSVTLADTVFGGLNTISVETRIAWLKKKP